MPRKTWSVQVRQRGQPVGDVGGMVAVDDRRHAGADVDVLCPVQRGGQPRPAVAAVGRRAVGKVVEPGAEVVVDPDAVEARGLGEFDLVEAGGRRELLQGGEVAELTMSPVSSDAGISVGVGPRRLWSPNTQPRPCRRTPDRARSGGLKGRSVVCPFMTRYERIADYRSHTGEGPLWHP